MTTSSARSTKPHPAALLNDAIQRIVDNPTTLDAELALLGRSMEAPDISAQVEALFNELKETHREDAIVKLSQAVLANTNELSSLRTQQREILATFREMLSALLAEKELVLDA